MKTKDKNQNNPISGPLLKSVMERDKANFALNFPDASVGSKPLDPPDLYQDAGGGYNRNLTYPQD